MGINTGGRGLHDHALDLREIVFRPLCLEEINWEETGTGGTGSGLLGDGRCRENSATLVLCSDIHGCCSDLVDASTGVRDGLHVHALERSEISFRPLCLEETSTEGRGPGLDALLVVLLGLLEHRTPVDRKLLGAGPCMSGFHLVGVGIFSVAEFLNLL